MFAEPCFPVLHVRCRQPGRPELRQVYRSRDDIACASPCFTRKTGDDLGTLPIFQHHSVAAAGRLYGGTYLITTFIKKEQEDTDAFMVSNHSVGFGMGAASMTAT
ncbi:hypothetical protein MBH78_16195 [Oceanimonas sp. NS1]|nr:hypothetical protein [Oceanimonas sp. NS1]